MRLIGFSRECNLCLETEFKETPDPLRDLVHKKPVVICVLCRLDIENVKDVVLLTKEELTAHVASHVTRLDLTEEPLRRLPYIVKQAAKHLEVKPTVHPAPRIEAGK